MCLKEFLVAFLIGQFAKYNSQSLNNWQKEIDN
jgi:hypothetical protein